MVGTIYLCCMALLEACSPFVVYVLVLIFALGYCSNEHTCSSEFGHMSCKTEDALCQQGGEGAAIPANRERTTGRRVELLPYQQYQHMMVFASSVAPAEVELLHSP